MKNTFLFTSAFLMGVGVTSLFAYSFSPYTVAQWIGLYEEAVIGHEIVRDPTIMQTGVIPQPVKEWYSARQ